MIEKKPDDLVWLIFPGYKPNGYESFLGYNERPERRVRQNRQRAEEIITEGRDPGCRIEEY